MSFSTIANKITSLTVIYKLIATEKKLSNSDRSFRREEQGLNDDINHC